MLYLSNKNELLIFYRKEENMSVTKIQANDGYRFEKFIFTTSLNSEMVGKYVSKTDKIRLIAENNDNMINKNSVIDFKNDEECSTFIDKKCGENDQYYNTARALQSLINAIV